MLDLGPIKARLQMRREDGYVGVPVDSGAQWVKDIWALVAEVESLRASEDKLEIYIAQARVDQLEAERDQARQARDVNASYKDDYNKRWQSVREQRNAVIQKCNRFGEELIDLRHKARAHKEQISKLDKERDELLDMLDDAELRIGKAEATAHQAKAERPKIDPTTLPEHHFIILKSHPDKPSTRVPCGKCGYTEFTKLDGDGLRCGKCGTVLYCGTSLHYTAQLDRILTERDKARQTRDDYEQRWRSARGQRDTAMQERDQTRKERDINVSYRDRARRQRDEARANCVSLRETIARLRNELDAKPSRPSCLSCGSTDYVWCFDNGESAYCSKCSPDTPPPPKPLLKFLSCPGCNRLLATLSEHLPPGRCCLCGAELSPPVCPHCGHDVFSPLAVIPTSATFKADGTMRLPHLYLFRCAKCGKEVGNLPLKRTDK